MNDPESHTRRICNVSGGFGTLLLIIFTIETLVMFLLPHILPDTHGSLGNFADSLLLALFSAPFIWWLAAGPQLRQSEEGARESEKRYHTLFENMHEGCACRPISSISVSTMPSKS